MNLSNGIFFLKNHHGFKHGLECVLNSFYNQALIRQVFPFDSKVHFALDFNTWPMYVKGIFKMKVIKIFDLSCLKKSSAFRYYWWLSNSSGGCQPRRSLGEPPWESEGRQPLGKSSQINPGRWGLTVHLS